MATKERINPKTGKKEYKVRYYFMREGKKRDSETAWFSTLAAAEKEAKALKEAKEAEDRNKITEKRNKKLYDVLGEYIDYLKQESKDSNSNNYAILLKRANAIYKNHFPNELMTIRINELEAFHFKRWISAINNKELGGITVKGYKSLISLFNVWMSHNDYYLQEDFEDLIDLTLRRTKIKSRQEGNRELKGERNFISILDFKKITYYYYKQGIEEFRNFYYYTMFYILYFGGLRVEELAGLQWKFIDLRESRKTIAIKNAISETEDKQKALNRVKKGTYRTKNRTSVRILPIFDFYYDLLCDYKESYRYEFNLTKEEVEEGFVFPNINMMNPNMYLDSQTALKELKKICKAVDIDNTDLQMFRHSCAYFLILPPPEGLGYSEEKVKDYFGHTDTTMLTSIYARLNTLQKADRLRDTFKDIYTASTEDEKTKEEEAKLELIRRIRGDNEKAEIARQRRIFAQIDRLISIGRTEYYYRAKDRKIIEQYEQEKGKDRIKFIEE